MSWDKILLVLFGLISAISTFNAMLDRRNSKQAVSARKTEALSHAIHGETPLANELALLREEVERMRVNDERVRVERERFVDLKLLMMDKERSRLEDAIRQIREKQSEIAGMHQTQIERAEIIASDNKQAIALLARDVNELQRGFHGSK